MNANRIRPARSRALCAFLCSAAATAVCALLIMSCAGRAEGASSEPSAPSAEPQTISASAPKYNDTSFRPCIDPNGKRLSTVSKYDFSGDGFGFVYNYDWAQYTYALDYGRVTVNSNPMYRLRTPGGELQPRLYAYAANGDDISSSEWVSMYVDMRGLRNSSSSSVGFYIYLSSSPAIGDQAASSSAPLFLREGAAGYYYHIDGTEWKSASVKDGMISVGADFAGYVAFPISSYEHVEEDGRKYVSGAGNGSGLFSAGYKYLCRVWTFCSVADPSESHTEILFDDLTFSDAGASHSHTFSYLESIPASCTSQGYDVYRCSVCGQYQKQSITRPSGHTPGEVQTSGDMSFYPCTECSHLEPCTAKGTASGIEVYSVSFTDPRFGMSTVRLYRKGDVIRYNDIPKGGICVDGYTYQFNAWTGDEALICPVDPQGMTVDRDMTFYARYLISDYADKYVGAVSVLAQNGGPYVREEGRVVVLGNSNMSLYHGLEASFASSSIPVYNNSVSGSTSYEMIEWFRVLVASYKPCAVVLNVTTNDMAYYNLPEKQIIENMVTLYELSRELIPDTHVFFVSGNPLPGRTEYAETIVRTNNSMARFCARAEKCDFIDVYARVLAIAGKYPTGWDTWTHMNQSNLKIMFDDIKAAILAWKANEGIAF